MKKIPLKDRTPGLFSNVLRIRGSFKPRSGGERSICLGLLFLAACLVFITGCQLRVTPLPVSEEQQVTPTVASLFQQEAMGTPQPTKTLIPTIKPVRTRQSWEDVLLAPIFTDELNSDWVLQENQGMDFDLANSETVYMGRKAIKVSPQQDYGRLFFTVKPDTLHAYPRKKMIGLSLWINGGENSIGYSSLAFTITGSNVYPYWDDLDRSAFFGSTYPFSETRLYYLGFNRAIPPNTWVKIQLLMDQLVFDPYYEYVTGFYIKNDEGFYSSFYIDEANFMMIDGGPELSGILASTRTPVIEDRETAEPTRSPTKRAIPPFEITEVEKPTAVQAPTAAPIATATPTFTITPTSTIPPSPPFIPTDTPVLATTDPTDVAPSDTPDPPPTETPAITQTVSRRPTRPVP